MTGPRVSAWRIPGLWNFTLKAGGAFGWANYVASLKLNYIYEVEIMVIPVLYISIVDITQNHTRE